MKGVLLGLMLIPVVDHFQIELFHRCRQRFVIAREVTGDGVVKEKQLFLHHFGLRGKKTGVIEFRVLSESDLILVEKLHLGSDIRLEFLVFVFGLVEFSSHFILFRTDGKHFQFCSTGIEFQSKGNDHHADEWMIGVLTERSRRDEWC